MSFYRVAGTLRAWYVVYDEPDEVTLDLVVPGQTRYVAICRAQAIADQGYDWSRWDGDPTVEEVQNPWSA